MYPSISEGTTTSVAVPIYPVIVQYVPFNTEYANPFSSTLLSSSALASVENSFVHFGNSIPTKPLSGTPVIVMITTITHAKIRFRFFFIFHSSKPLDFSAL